MKSVKLVAAACALSAAIAGVAQADLATDLTTMSPADALAKATQDQSVSIQALIADAAAKLQDNPALLSALVGEAVKAYPEQAGDIVKVAVSQAPAHQSAITNAAVAQLQDNPEAQAAVNKAADEAAQQVVTGETKTGTESEAQQQETAAPTPPPPPAPQPPAPDKPPVVSPN